VTMDFHRGGTQRDAKVTDETSAPSASLCGEKERASR
jgi:hypothetical protein